jgi:MFS family permease
VYNPTPGTDPEHALPDPSFETASATDFTTTIQAVGENTQWVTFILSVVVAVSLFLIDRYFPRTGRAETPRPPTHSGRVGVSGWVCVVGLFNVLICVVLNSYTGIAWLFGWALTIGGGLVWIVRIPARRAASERRNQRTGTHQPRNGPREDH